VNSTDRSAREIWTILSEKGKKVGIVNVPLTYPPKSVNGFMITGMMTPPKSDNFTYPPLLKEEVEKVVGGSTLDPLLTSLEREDVFINEVFDSTEKMAKISILLTEKHESDLFMVVFNGTDYIQHRFWKYIDPKHPEYEAEKSAKYRKMFLQFYQKIDEILGNFLKMADERTTLIVMSDHGFGPLHKYIHVNSWLMQMDLLKLRKRPKTRLKRFLYKIGINPEKILNALFSIHLVNIRIKTNRTDEKLQNISNKFFLSFSDVDWHKTKAYSIGSGSIYINLKGREPSGTVSPGQEYESLREQISTRLYGLKDPETGEFVIEKVCKKEEIYNGPHIDTLPDIVFIPKPGYTTFEEHEFAAKSVITQAKTLSGTHRLNGILLMRGGGIKKSATLQDASIMDLAPTILYLLGLPIPTDMDGRVLEEALTSSYLRLNPIRYEEEAKDSTRFLLKKRDEVYEDEDEEKIKSRLRALGYIA
jgi:predicted AlkP superfamily phosphohydrolase/phosphomutase